MSVGAASEADPAMIVFTKAVMDGPGEEGCNGKGNKARYNRSTNSVEAAISRNKWNEQGKGT